MSNEATVATDTTQTNPADAPQSETTADNAPLDGSKAAKTFSSEFSTIMTGLGAAVGTGNIWRFPRILAKNVRPGGGLGFLISWFLSLFFWSIPMVILEYGLGRKNKKMHINTFHKYLGHYGAWKGAFIVFVQLAVSCYYIVVVSWCFYYLFFFMINPLPNNSEDSLKIFYHLTEETRYPALILFILSIVICLSISKGVKSFELINQITVPVLFLIILIGFYYSLFLPYASSGVGLVFSMDWSYLATANAFIDGISQNAWDTGAGTGIYLTFATYMKKDSKVVSYALITPILNNMISLMMGVTTFCTSFDYLTRNNPEITQTGILTIMKDNGPANTGLTLVWMPVFFENFHNGRAVCIIFYFCLCMAGLTSIISMIEMLTRQVTQLKLSRRYAAPAVCLAVCLGGFCNTRNAFLANQDYVWGYGSVICGGYFIYLVCAIGAEDFRIEFLNKFSAMYNDIKVPKFWALVVSMFIPFQIFMLFVWWLEESMRGGHWWMMKEESFLTCVLQWSIVSLFLFTLNRIYIKKYHESWKLLDDPEPWNPINDFSTPTYPNQNPVRTIQAVPTSNPAFQIESDQFNQIDDLPTYEQATREDQKGSVSLSPTSAAYTNQSFQS